MQFIKNFQSLFVVAGLSLILIACGGNNNSFENDYSDAPALADTSNALSKVITDSGVIYYVISTGDSTSFEVTIRDNIFIYYTTRTLDGEIIASSYVNGSTSAVSILNIGSQTRISFVGEGLAPGVLGMFEGERRVIFIPEDVSTIDEAITIDVELELVDE
ncbi:MAG: hypothetical protein ED557_02980 [Balneola sp.]|nr:MAG: hypothetical protein ED557_02980 [Balneola sp.]